MDNQHNSTLKHAATPLLHPLFYSAFTLFLIHQSLEHYLHISWIDSYLDDIVFPLVLFPILSFIFQILQIPSVRPLPVRMVILITLLCTLYFEYILPQISLRFTSDSLDIICYLAGTVIFQIFQNKMYTREL